MTFTDPWLCAAIVDRLIFGGTIIETGTDSSRRAYRASINDLVVSARCGRCHTPHSV